MLVFVMARIGEKERLVCTKIDITAGKYTNKRILIKQIKDFLPVTTMLRRLIRLKMLEPMLIVSWMAIFFDD